jgi:hypothetical protein
MKLILPLLLFAVSFSVKAQNNNLPTGRYETILKQGQSKWSEGDIILVDASHYKISSSEEVGEYKYSATAQRIIFISGPLKTVYARTAVNTNKPTIILPLAENEQQGVKLVTADVIAYLKN